MKEVVGWSGEGLRGMGLVEVWGGGGIGWWDLKDGGGSGYGVVGVWQWWGLTGMGWEGGGPRSDGYVANGDLRGGGGLGVWGSGV